MNIVTVICVILLLSAIVLIYLQYKNYSITDEDFNTLSYVKAVITGGVVCFFDTLGIGSFAPTTLILRTTKLIRRDKLLPGTLNVALTVTVIFEAILFVNEVKVDLITLVSMVAAATVGGFLGAKVISKLPEETIRVIIGIALITTAVLMALRQLGIFEILGQGNTAEGLSGYKLMMGVVINFTLGILMAAGIGLYAPCMAMLFMLGMNPLYVFPIMMCSCAFLMPAASVEFIRTNTYHKQLSIALPIGGVIGVATAYRLVKSLDIEILSWLVVVVVAYTGLLMLSKYIFKNTRVQS